MESITSRGTLTAEKSDYAPYNEYAFKAVFAGFCCLAAGIFTSVGICAGYHCLMLIPGLWMVWREVKIGNVQAIPRSAWALLILIGVMAFSNFLNWENMQQPLRNTFKLKYFFFGIIGFFGIRWLLRHSQVERWVKPVTSIFFLSIIASVSYALFGSMTGYDLKTGLAYDSWRQGGLTGTMRFGYGMGMVLPLLLGLWLRRHECSKFISFKLLLPAIVLGTAGLFLTQCRGAILAALLASSLVVYLDNPKRGKILGLLGLSVFLLLPTIIISGAGNTEGESRLSVNRIVSDLQGDERVTIFHAAFLSIKENPLTGIGYRQFGGHYGDIKKRYNLKDKEESHPHAHNIFLEIGASAGILGVIGLIAWLGLWMREMASAGGMTCLIGVPFCVALIIGGQFEYVFDANNSFLIFAVYAATIGVVQFDSQDKTAAVAP